MTNIIIPGKRPPISAEFICDNVVRLNLFGRTISSSITHLPSIPNLVVGIDFDGVIYPADTEHYESLPLPPISIFEGELHIITGRWRKDESMIRDYCQANGMKVASLKCAPDCSGPPEVLHYKKWILSGFDLYVDDDDEEAKQLSSVVTTISLLTRKVYFKGQKL